MDKHQAEIVGETLLEPAWLALSEASRKREEQQRRARQYSGRVTLAFLGAGAGGALGYFLGGQFAPAGVFGAGVGSLVGVAIAFFRQRRSA